MKVVYFDGHCNLCNTSVDFLIRRDVRRRLKFAPLQGETARARLPADLVGDLGTVVFDDGSRLHVRSSAVVRTLVALGGAWRLAGVLLLIPAFLRDPLYRFVARSRYRWFGRRETCRLPTPEERDQFLS